MNDDQYTVAIVSALDGMKQYGPDHMLDMVNFNLRRADVELSEAELVEILTTGDPNTAERTRTHIMIAQWDAVSNEDWASETLAGSIERREYVLTKLGFGEVGQAQINACYPRATRHDTVIADPGAWDPWYNEELRSRHSFYWQAYSGILRSKLHDPEALAALSASTDNIVSRLADPASSTAYQAKGLVVGHVQSGKTANFTGVIAKAVDAGYRLVIVLTGTVEMLRAQTQRRLDMELVGEENILGGIDRTDADAVGDIDYIGDGDKDWLAGKFLKHGVPIIDLADTPSIRRLTTLKGDYRLLKAGLPTLDFRQGNELVDRFKPLYDPVNLFGSDVRLAIVKKNKSVLEKLVHDLKRLHVNLGEIPTLIIDDEADQASVNTKDQRKRTKEDIDRTAINGLIAELLGLLKRAQYVGYTATPFANVFVSPEDSEDIFPKDFIVNLTPSPEYMGGKHFHDLDGVPDGEDHNPAFSNQATFVRDLKANVGEEERKEIRNALDAFVLSGAIKLWRAAGDPGLSFRHHTMLVHESVKTDEHSELARLIRSVWGMAGFTQAEGLARLRELYLRDFVPVHGSREWQTALPDQFDELTPYIGSAIDKIMVAHDPVAIVNGSKESDYQLLDFQKDDIWRVMVGGTKLSRGFTIEGLTITYYKRRALKADTLMQMGRWFGYREGYRDLVRLYIARDVPGPRGRTYDLYDAFEAIVRDEEDFRAQLEKFAELTDDGDPLVKPIDVPPMVFQQLPWLSPTARNKMYNAELAFQGEGGSLKDFPRHAKWGDGAINKKHFELVSDWISELGPLQEFTYDDSGTIRSFEAQVAVVPAQEMLDVLGEFVWTEFFSLEPNLEFMRIAIAEGTLRDWAVLVPSLTTSTLHSVDGTKVPLMNRNRRGDREGFSGSSFRQRAAIEHIAGKPGSDGGANAAALRTSTRGAMLLTFAADPAEGLGRDHKLWPEIVDPRDIATIFSLALPNAAAPKGRIGFRVRDYSKRGMPIIDVG